MRDLRVRKINFISFKNNFSIFTADELKPRKSLNKNINKAKKVRKDFYSF